MVRGAGRGGGEESAREQFPAGVPGEARCARFFPHLYPQPVVQGASPGEDKRTAATRTLSYWHRTGPGGNELGDKGTAF